MLTTALALALSVAPAHAVPAPGTVTLDAMEAVDLTWMREEEKLARDVYITSFRRWGIQAFSNIAYSEHAHLAQMEDALDIAGLPDPVTRPGVGRFSDPTLRALYQDLTARSARSAAHAVYTGAFIEELDIVDLADAIARNDEPWLQNRYAMLMCGSRNHLRSFVGLMESQGYVYVSQVLPQADVDAIVNSPVEACGRQP